MKYFFSSYAVDFTISLFYSSKEFDTKHGKGNCEDNCHQGTVGGNWKCGVYPNSPKPVGEEHAYNPALPDLAISSESRCASKSLSVLNRLIRLEISHVWWTRFVNHTRLLDPLQTARLNFCASRESTERPVAGRPRRHRKKIIFQHWKLIGLSL